MIYIRFNYSLNKETTMKRMTYKTLVKKIQDGYAEVYAWSGCYAHVRFIKSGKVTKQEVIEVTNIPVDFLR